ncbi:CRISPR-associated protein, Csy1 family [Olavius sp. associated proteobacterium Delta 1]|nr:CRISPR-associated protein, Csy1 family [Olavius sp. associated proteobacterium Delta 1]
MVDPALDVFFTERKEAWLKKNIKASMKESEVREKQLECMQMFSREAWLPNAARRAGQMSLATHPCTFSHPSARKNKNGYATPVIADAGRSADGFLRSGNVVVETDALGNAAVLDVYKFLTLKMEDSKKLIEHIQEDSELAIDLLSIHSESYEKLKSGFLAMIDSDACNAAITSSKIKQVYFPVIDDYHQLSLLSNSGMVYELRKRFDIMRFSDESKELKELKRNNIFSERSFVELYNLTTIGYGGTKPQNISVINNQNGGKANLLFSAPPTLQKRDIRFPKKNFFSESFSFYEYREIFDALHKLFKTDYSNIRIREGRDYRLQDLMDRIITKMWAVRAVSKEQYRSEHSQLKPHQKTWLCEEFQQTRAEKNDWIDKLCKEISNWIIRTYEKLLGKQAYKLGDSERLHIHEIVTQNREALR